MSSASFAFLRIIEHWLRAEVFIVSHYDRQPVQWFILRYLSTLWVWAIYSYRRQSSLTLYVLYLSCPTDLYSSHLSALLSSLSGIYCKLLVSWSAAFSGLCVALCGRVTVVSRRSRHPPPARPLSQHTRVINWAGEGAAAAAAAGMTRDEENVASLIRNCDVASASHVSSTTSRQHCRSLDER